MVWVALCAGLVLSALDYVPQSSSTLRRNIAKRLLVIACGALTIRRLAPAYLILNGASAVVGILLGMGCLAVHVALARGIKLRRTDLGTGMRKTIALIYLLELPAEEFLYRGLVFLSCLHLWGVWPATMVSCVLFTGLHLKTWRDPAVWVGSAFLSVICALAVVWTGSLWTAVFIHDLNDFGFLTLVGRRNVFPEDQPRVALDC
jgi:membrane protease YdiL (CAAX protease family)